MTPTPADCPRANGMPMLGLGTWQNATHDQCVESVRAALEMGYRHVDTAQAYGNEAAVGDAIEQASVPREEIFLATKVWLSRLGRDDVIESTGDSLERLGTEYVDLLYVHWPTGEYDPEETLAAFDQLSDEGRIRNVGVSNFEPHHVDRARDVLDAPLFANQVELHPFLQQDELRAYAAEHDIELVAYSPLARGRVVGDERIGEIADRYGVSEPQVSLAWLHEKGVTAIPKATSETHIRDNWESLTLDLDEAAIERIDAIERTERAVNPDFAPAAWD